MERLPLVIPAYEPSGNVVDYVKALISEGFDDIVVVDDGSGEKYKKIFSEIDSLEECKVLYHAVNMGKGRALKTAFNYLLVKNNDIRGCITADSDGQHAVSDVIKCNDSFLSDKDELILGSRDFSLDHIPNKSKFGNKLTKIICRYLYGINISDTQTGLRVIPNRLMSLCLNISGERFEFETNMLISCRENEIPFKEVPIETIYESKTDHATHFNPVADSIKIYKIFAARFFKYIFSSFSACILDLILFSLFCILWRNESSLNYVFIATFLARLFSATYNYLLNYSFVYKSKESRVKSAFKYATLAIVQMSISSFGVVGILNVIRINETVVKIFVDTILFFVNYLIQRKYVFKK